MSVFDDDIDLTSDVLFDRGFKIKSTVNENVTSMTMIVCEDYVRCRGMYIVTPKTFIKWHKFNPNKNIIVTINWHDKPTENISYKINTQFELDALISTIKDKITDDVMILGNYYGISREEFIKALDYEYFRRG